MKYEGLTFEEQVHCSLLLLCMFRGEVGGSDTSLKSADGKEIPIFYQRKSHRETGGKMYSLLKFLAKWSIIYN